MIVKSMKTPADFEKYKARTETALSKLGDLGPRFKTVLKGKIGKEAMRIVAEEHARLRFLGVTNSPGELAELEDGLPKDVRSRYMEIKEKSNRRRYVYVGDEK